MDDIEYVEVPDRLLPALGERDPKRRAYHQIGRKAEFERWWDAVCEICGKEGKVSPGGGAMFAPVSRGAVYKRIKEGRLTAFLFHNAPKGRRWQIRDLFRPDGPGWSMFVPVSELRSWGRLIRERRGELPPEDFDTGFLELKRQKLREYLRQRDAQRR